jgi:Spy/CpxP family protein refolding chaperone
MVRRWLVVLAMALVSLGAVAQGGPPAAGPAGPRRMRDADERRDTVRLYLVHRMREALALSDAQTLKVLDVMEAIDTAREAHQATLRSILARLRAGLNDPSTSDATFKETVADVQKEQAQFEAKARDLESQLLAVLTPRQQAQYIILRRQLIEEMGQRLGGRGAGVRPKGRWQD